MKNQLLKALAYSIITALLLAVPGGGQQSTQRAVQSPLEQLSDSLQAVVRKVSPSIVEIEVSGYTRSEQEEDEDSPRPQRGSHVLTRTHSIGSGVILDSDGYIVTNAHVLEGARRVRVTVDEKLRRSHPHSLGNRASTTFEAKIIGSCEDMDLAVVKIEAHDLPTIPFADSDLIQPGQLVLALGSPEGLRNSVSIGIVSAVGRVNESDSTATYIQTDAAINGGSSGGALVDVKGDLVGITSYMITEGGGSEGLGFALPAKLVYSVFAALKNDGHVNYGDIGIRVQDVTPELSAALQLAQDWGIIVSDLEPDSSAARAGVQIQDIISTLDGNPISSSPQFAAALYHKKPGDYVRLGLLRGPRKFGAQARVSEKTHPSDNSPYTANLDNGLITRLGILCAQVNADDHHAHPELRSDSGVMVVARLASSDSKLISGDVIQSVNGTKVTNVEGLRNLIDKLKRESVAVFRVERRKQFKYITIEID